VTAALPPAWQVGELVRLPTKQHVVALTFDGGGNDAAARSVVAALRRTNTPATFFLTGRFVRLYPQLARDIGAAYPVADHTVDHADLTHVSDAQVRWEVDAAATQIRNATGEDPKPLFRFPYGARDARTMRDVQRLGFVSIRWTVDTWGWMGRCCQTVNGVVRRVVDHLVPGEIVLAHLGSARDGATLDAQALPRLIAAVRARGYSFVTLAGIRSR
jgi:peptidoglycan/xylan/chitin deacetylase (PgdA/CDA1 family)